MTNYYVLYVRRTKRARTRAYIRNSRYHRLFLYNLFLLKRTYTSPNWKPTGGHEKISRSLQYKLCAIMVLRIIVVLPAHNRTRFYIVYFVSFLFFIYFFTPFKTWLARRCIGNRALTIMFTNHRVTVLLYRRPRNITSTAFKCRNFHSHRKTLIVSRRTRVRVSFWHVVFVPIITIRVVYK